MAVSTGLVWKDWRTARDQLKEWREESYRRSKEVVELGRRLLKDYSSALGDEGDTEQANTDRSLRASSNPRVEQI